MDRDCFAKRRAQMEREEQVTFRKVAPYFDAMMENDEVADRLVEALAVVRYAAL